METSKYIHISTKHSLEKIRKFLIEVLQYKSQESEIDEYDDFEHEWLHFFKEEDYKYYAGVYAEIYLDEEYCVLHF